MKNFNKYLEVYEHFYKEIPLPHSVKKEEINRVEDFLNFFHIQPGSIILNAGCGFDYISYWLSTRGYMTEPILYRKH